MHKRFTQCSQIIVSLGPTEPVEFKPTDKEYSVLSRIIARKEKHSQSNLFSLWKSDCKLLGKILRIKQFDPDDITHIEMIRRLHSESILKIDLTESIDIIYT